MATESEPKYLFAKMVRGHPFPDAPMFPDENIEFTMDYVPLDGDIIIASYPKTGTTWLQYIVLQILSKGTSFPEMRDLSMTVAPFMEMAGKVAVENLKPPRTIKHHFPYNLVQKNRNSKCIYIYRKPEDVCASYYHFSQSTRQIKIDQDVFFDAFVEGRIAYGSYFSHVLSFLEHKEDANLLMVSYEKLWNNTREEVLRIARFIGEEHYTELLEDPELMKKLLETTSFGNMKEKLVLKTLNSGLGIDSETNIDFFRKGVIGDGKNVFSAEQLNKMKSIVVDMMKGTSLIDEWINYEF